MNRLHATSPQGTMGIPFAVASGLQRPVSLALLGSLSCLMLRLLAYLKSEVKSPSFAYVGIRQEKRSATFFVYHLWFW